MGRRGNARLNAGRHRARDDCDDESDRPEQARCRWRERWHAQRLPSNLGRFDADVVAKAKICLLDFLSCAFEARNHPWSRQAIGIARAVGNGATIVGTGTLAAPGDAAFANATMGHGLVREDMHAASICHHGVVIWPTLLALSERTPLSGATFLAAAIIGYETGAQIGRALFTADLARLYRPTGLVAPLGAALAGSYALGLTEDAATSAMAIAANTSSGLNEWPRAGGSEMYFHPGFAARNAIAAIELAEAGARASETILEGEAGLFAAFRRQPAPTEIRLFAGAEPEIMAVYNKPAPACNFAQTAAQAALRVARELGTSEDIETVSIRVPDAAARYPGCDSKGPFRNALQAKMSIPFSVAAVLARGALEEDNYADVDDPRILRLVERTDLQSEPDLHRRVPGASRAPRSSSACATERPSISASTMSLPPRRRKSAPAFGRLLPTPSATSAHGIWKSWSTIAHRFRTAASSPPGAGLNRPSNGCGQHHDR